MNPRYDIEEHDLGPFLHWLAGQIHEEPTPVMHGLVNGLVFLWRARQVPDRANPPLFPRIDEALNPLGHYVTVDRKARRWRWPWEQR
jgi:hypothetical protein